MGGIYDITGWSGGGRRPITHNLRPGQFRGMGSVNVFEEPTRVVINNNVGDGRSYFDYGYEEPSMPTWMQWMMGGGMAMNFLGQIFQAVMPHSNGIDGRGSARGEMTDNQKQDLAMYTDVLKNAGYKVSGPSSTGEFILTDVTSKKSQKFENFETLKNYIDNNLVENDDAEPPTAELTAEERLQEQLKGAQQAISGETYEDITAEIKDGKIQYMYEGKYYNTLSEAVNAKTKAPAKTNNGVASTEGAPKVDAGKYEVRSNETWYEIVQKYTLPEGKTMYQAIGELKKLNGIENRQEVTGPSQKADNNGYIQIPNGWELKDS